MATVDSNLEPPPRGPNPGPPSQALVAVGAVVNAHGPDGRIRVQPHSSDPDRFRRGARLLIAGRSLAVERVQRAARGGVLLKLDGVDTRQQAVELRGETIEVAEGDLPSPPPDVYYHYQLLDMTVVDESGAEIGTLTEIVPAGGANDVYVVVSGGAELLLPALGDVVLSVDIAAKRMTVAVPEGLEWRSLETPKTKPRRTKRRPPGSFRPAGGESTKANG